VPVLSLIWLAIDLWAAHGQISQSVGSEVALTNAAYALPGVVQATLVAGIGLAVLGTLPIAAGRTDLRVIVAIIAGAVAGGASGAAVAVAYPHLPSIGGLVTTLVIAGAIGGLLTVVPVIATAAPGALAAALAGLIVVTILNSNRVLSTMLRWFGSGSGADSLIAASKRVQFVDYLVVGLIVGIVAFLRLRRTRLRSTPAYVLAGALPGVLLLVAYGLAQIGGSRLLDAANALSEADKLINDLEWSEVVPNAMIVLFVGALTAMIAYGRTLTPARRANAGAVPAQKAAPAGPSTGTVPTTATPDSAPATSRSTSRSTSGSAPGGTSGAAGKAAPAGEDVPASAPVDERA